MPKYEIVVGADFKEVDKGFKQAENLLNKFLGKKGKINIDSKEAQFNVGHLDKIYTNLQNRIKNLTSDISKLDNELSKTTEPKKATDLKVRIHDLGKQLSSTKTSAKDLGDVLGKTLEKNDEKTKKSQGLLEKWGRAMGGLQGGVTGRLGRMGAAIPYVGGLVGAAFGVGYGISSFVAPRRQLAESNLRYMGLSGYQTQGQLVGLRQSGLQYGYGPQEAIQQAINLRRVTGSIQGLGGYQRLLRTSGMEQGDILGAAGAFRMAGEKGGAGIDRVKKIFTEALQVGFDRSRAADLLESISSYTGEMATTGGVNVNAVQNIIMGLMRQSGFFAQNAQRGMVALKGAEAAFTGTGPMAGLAFRTLQKIKPEASMMELYHLRRLGFTQPGGVGPKEMMEFAKTVGQAALGGRVNIQKGAVLSKDDYAAFASAISEALGIKQSLADELANVIIGKSTADPHKTLLEIQNELSKSEKDILQSTDSLIAKQGKTLENISMTLADKLLPVDMAIKDAIMFFAEKLGYETPEKKIERQGKRELEQFYESTSGGRKLNISPMTDSDFHKKLLENYLSEKFSGLQQQKITKDDVANEIVGGRDKENTKNMVKSIVEAIMEGYTKVSEKADKKPTEIHVHTSTKQFPDLVHKIIVTEKKANKQ